MNEDKKEYLNYAFKWGTIIGFFTFLWYLVGFFTGLDKSLYFGDLYFVIEMLLIIAMILQYKRQKGEEKVKFSRMLLICFLSVLVIAGFYALYFVLRITKLDPLFFEAYVQEVVTLMKNSFSVDYSQIFTPEMSGVMKVSFIVAIFISTVINNMIYVLLSLGFVYLNEKIYKKRS